MKHKLFSLLLAVVVSVGTMNAEIKNGTCGTNLTWSLNTEDSTLTISGTGVMTDYTSSSSVPWYSDRSSIKSISLPDGLTTIGGYAFSGCSALTSITIPNSVTTIGNYAFQNCTGLTSVHISDMVAWCAISFYYYYSNPLYYAHNLYLNGELITNLVIPGTVTSIKNYAFQGCAGLTSVTIPNSVTSIGEWAFEDCTGLTSVTIPNSVTSIGDMAFYDCSSLTSVMIPNSVTSIGSLAFFGCTGLTSVTIPNSVTRIGQCAIGQCTFSLVPNIVYNGSATGAPWGAKSLNGYVDGWFVYSDATKTTLLACSSSASENVIIPNSVTSIGQSAFEGCRGLTSVEIPNSVTSIGNRAFYDCSSLTSVIVLPETPPTLGSLSFGNMAKGVSIIVPRSAIDAYRSAWNSYSSQITYEVVESGTCGTNLTWSLNTEDSTLTISGTGVMSNYNISNNPAPWRQDSAYIKHLIFENGITSIGTYAFYNCTNLISVSIPNSVESIGNYAFQFCSNLPFVTIPQNVTSIGKQAFRGCRGLKWFACQAVTPPTLGSDVFYGVHRKTPMFVPSASIDEYKNAAWWSEFVNYISSWGDCGDNFMWYLNTIDSTLTIQGTGAMTDYTSSSSVPWYSDRSSIKSISLPDGLTTIGGYAFSGCSGLTSITIPHSVTSIGNYAFDGCTGLTGELVIPNSVTSIGGYAFSGCSALTSITIPNNVTNIGNSTFSNCTGLTYIVCYASAVPTLGTNTWMNVDKTIPLYVPEESVSSYANASGWNDFTTIDSLSSVFTSGTCGENLQWSYNAITHKLTITGSGAMWDFSLSCGAYSCRPQTPWPYRSIKSISLPDGLTTIGRYAFWYCSSLTSVTIPNSVTSIGQLAFGECTSLTSVTIPNSVTSIADEAFYLVPNIVYNGSATGAPWGAKSLNGYVDGWFVYSDATKTTLLACSSSASEDVIIPNSVTSIGQSAFEGCRGLTSVEIPNSVTSIGNRAFYDCSSLTSVTIGNNVTSIGDYAFYDCLYLTDVTIFAETPPTLGSSVFSYASYLYQYTYQYYSTDRTIVVPCSALQAYRFAWGGNIGNSYFSIKDTPSSYHVTLQTEGSGSIYAETLSKCNEDAYSMSAWSYEGYSFIQWSDGNTDNPRVATITSDTTFTAEFGIAKSGRCGDNYVLQWVYNSTTKTLTISGIGALSSYYTYGLEAPSEVENLIIEEGVTAIGNSAFSGYTTLKYVSIASSVKTIYDQAFYNCTCLENIYSYREQPSNAYSNSFDGVNKFECTLHVLSASIDMYKAATGWHDFYYIQTIDAKKETEQITSVVVTPAENAAKIAWPINNGAATYTIDISKDGTLVCTLTFNANGQLTGIAFAAPSIRHDAAQETITGYSFTITSLTPGTTYNYSLVAKNVGGTAIDTKNGTFTTLSPTGIEDVLANPSAAKDGKVLHDGQIYILRDGKVYDLTGREIM